MAENPLVSLCITCYNQAEYIKESLQSAFDQTYSPLEIVICDDCSTDGTDRIVKEMLAEYKGQHKLVFHRNKSNLFVAKNYEQAFKMARGELLVTGAGDDISMPSRVEKIVEAYLASNKTASCIVHGWTVIDKSGSEISVQNKPWPIETQLGAVTTYRRDVVDKFMPLPMCREIYEDGVFTLRALALGVAIELDEPLCKWRVGTGRSTGARFQEKRRRIARHQVLSCKIFEEEMKEFGDSLSSTMLAGAKQVKDWRMRHYEPEYVLCAGKTMGERRRAWSQLNMSNGWNITFGEKWFIRAPMILPWGIGSVVECLYRFALYMRLHRILKNICCIVRPIRGGK